MRFFGILCTLVILVFGSSQASACSNDTCRDFRTKQNQPAYTGKTTSAKAVHCYVVRARQPTAILFRRGAGVNGPEIAGTSFRKDPAKWHTDRRWPGFVVREACTDDLTAGGTFTICGDVGHTVVREKYFAKIRRDKRVTACIAGKRDCHASNRK